ncbi:MAG TPA: response regulator [Bacteroidia bacterium]|nr:response regulator [Bacteroidia bacterium]
MSNNTLFVLVDDDLLNHIISIATIKKTLNYPRIKDFIDPEAGVDFIKKLNPSKSLKVIVLLDINMPVMAGWDVLNELEKLDAKIKKQIQVFVLSSSVYQEDKARANSYNLVTGYIEKPLNAAKFEALLTKAKLPQYI